MWIRSLTILCLEAVSELNIKSWEEKHVRQWRLSSPHQKTVKTNLQMNGQSLQAPTPPNPKHLSHAPHRHHHQHFTPWRKTKTLLPLLTLRSASPKLMPKRSPPPSNPSPSRHFQPLPQPLLGTHRFEPRLTLMQLRLHPFDLSNHQFPRHVLR